MQGISTEVDESGKLIARPKAQQGLSVDENGRVVQQAPQTTVDELGHLVQPASASSSISRMRSAWDGVRTGGEYLIEQLTNRVPGQIGAAGEIALGSSTRLSPHGRAYGDFWKLVKLSFPGISGEKPNFEDFERVAAHDDKFAQVWDHLKDLRKQSELAASDAFGKAPDWDAIERSHLEAVYKSVEARWKAGERPSPENHLPDPRNTRDMMNYAAETAVPGQSRVPLTDQEMLDAAYDVIRARSVEDISALNPYAKAAMRGASVGGPLAILARAVPGGVLAQGLFGGLYELGRQALGIESGAQKKIEPGQVMLSALMMGAASKMGQAAAEALPMIPKTAGITGQLGTFEAAAGGQKLFDLATKKRAEPGAPDAEQGPSLWQAFAEHVIESAVTVGIGALTAKGEWKPPEGSASDYLSTEVTSKAFRETLRSALKIKTGFVPERITARRSVVEEQFVPLEAAMMQAKDNLGRALKEASGGDKELSQKINDATRIALESQGRIPVDENLVFPDKFQDIMDLQRKAGEALLKVGEFQYSRPLPHDQKFPYARYRMPDKTFVTVKEGETTPVGGLLIGGILYGRERGFYFPAITKDGFKPPEEPISPRESSGPNKPMEEMKTGELAAKHSMARLLTFDESYAQRPLDYNIGKAYQVFVDETFKARNDSMLDLSRADGDLLTKAELPNNPAKEKMLQRANDLEKTIRSMKDGFSDLTPFDQIRRRNQIVSLRAEADALRTGSKGKLYKRLVGEKYGPYEGMYLHKDALQTMSSLKADPSGLAAVFREVNSIIKSARVGSNLRAWIQDLTGNQLQWGEAGIDPLELLKETPGAIKKNLGFGIKDRTDYLFDTMASRASIGGAPDLPARELNQISRYKRQIAELEEEGKSATAMKAAALLAKRGDLLKNFDEWAKKLPGPLSLVRLPAKALDALFWIPTGRRLMIDMAQARAAFRVLTRKGVGDSGPMTPAQAFDEVAAVADYRLLPSTVQGAANVATYLRWPAKYVQSTLTKTMKRRPAFFGKPITTPMDAIIAAAPGSGPAQAALIARGLTRLATTGARWLPYLAATQVAAAKMLGIDQKELDKQLDDRTSYLPGAVAWLTKKTMIPVGHLPNGQIDTIDAGQFIPALVTMRYFSSSSRVAPIWYQILQKNQILGPLAQGVAGTDYGYHATPRGIGPGESWWRALTLALPAFPLAPLEEYFKQQNIPESERSTLRLIARQVVGIPLTSLSDRSFFQKEVERLYAQGNIGRTVSENGAVSYYPNNQFDVYSAAMISGAKDPANASQVIMRMYHEQQRIIEAMQQATELTSGSDSMGIR